jgi:hypothetical protein
MKRQIWRIAIALIFLSFPLYAAAVDYLAEADKFFDQGGIENYKKSIDLYAKAVEQQPEDYEATWKSRAGRRFAPNTARPACNTPRRPSN